jgi:hypothetical protein
MEMALIIFFKKKNDPIMKRKAFHIVRSPPTTIIKKDLFIVGGMDYDEDHYCITYRQNICRIVTQYEVVGTSRIGL